MQPLRTRRPALPPGLVAAAFVPPLLVSCAGDRPATWSEVGGYEKPAAETADEDPVQEAKTTFSDDSCMSIASAHLEKDRDLAFRIARECIKRKDFMLLPSFADPKWKGFTVPSEEWDGLMRAAMKSGSPDAVDLRPVGIDADWLTDTDEPEPGRLYLVIGVAMGARTSPGRGVVIKPIVYGGGGGQSTQRTTSKYNILDEQGNVLEENVTMVRERKTGAARTSSVLDETFLVRVWSVEKFKRGERYVFLVDEAQIVRSDEENAPTVEARVRASSPILVD